MHCGHCGNVLEDHFRFCSRCGAATENAPATGEIRLSRPREGKKIAGVCAGFARYLDVDVTLIRIVWLLLVIFPPPGLLAYIICWIVMPQDPPPARQEASSVTSVTG